MNICLIDSDHSILRARFLGEVVIVESSWKNPKRHSEAHLHFIQFVLPQCYTSEPETIEWSEVSIQNCFLEIEVETKHKTTCFYCIVAQTCPDVRFQHLEDLQDEAVEQAICARIPFSTAWRQVIHKFSHEHCIISTVKPAKQ